MKSFTTILLGKLPVVIMAGLLLLFALPPMALAQQDRTIFGLHHMPLGNASLDISNGLLAVSNIGQSGQDGVSVELGEADFWISTVLGDPSPQPNIISITAYGQVNGAAELPLVFLQTEEQEDGQFTATADYSEINSATQTVQVWQDSRLVVELENLIRPVIQFPPFGCRIDPIWVMDGEIWTLIDFEEPTPITLPGLAPAMGNRLVFIAENPGIESIDHLSRVEIVGQGLPSFSLKDGVLGAFHLPHRALGQAIFDAKDGTLTISNIGSSGQDGVAIDLGEAGRFPIDWSDVGPVSSTKDGSLLRISAEGEFGGRPDQILGSVLVQDVGSMVQVTADYSPIGSQTQRLEIFNGSKLVGIIEGHAGIIARIPEWPDGCDKRPTPPFPDPPLPCYILEWNDPIGIAIGGGDILVGTELRILAENPSATLNHLSQFTLQLADLPSLTVIREGEDAPTAGRAITAFGLEHLSLGNARLDTTESGLLVSNIGSSGQDGVRVELGQSEGLIYGMQMSQPISQLPEGAFVEVTVYGEVDGLPDQPIAVNRIVKVDTSFHTTVSMLGSIENQVTVLDDGEVILIAPLPFQDSIILPELPFQCDPWLWLPPDGCRHVERFPIPIPIEIPGIGFVTGDQLYIESINPPQRPGFASFAAITASNISSFEIVQESLNQFGSAHTAAGNARFQPAGGELTIDNIGANGLDGVSVELPGVQNFDVDLRGLSLEAPNSSIELQATGSFNGQTGVNFGSASLVNNNGKLEALVDYRAVGVQNARVLVYNAGVLIGEAIVPAIGRIGGFVIAQPPILDDCGKLPPPPPWPWPCFYFGWRSPFIFTAADGTELAGTEIRILADGLQGTFDGLTQFTLLGTNLSSIPLMNEVLPGIRTTEQLDISNGLFNLISLPAAPDELGVESLFSDATVFGFTQERGYQLLETVIPHYGYWMISGESDFQIPGNSLDKYTVTVQPGWTLIGGLTGTAIVKVEPANALRAMFRFNPQGSYELTSVIEPGEGVWLNVSETAFVTVCPASESTKQVRAAASTKYQEAEWSATLVATGEASGSAANTSNVVIAGSHAGLNTVPAAPPPPQYTALIQLWPLNFMPAGSGPYFQDTKETNTSPAMWVLEVDPHGNVPPPVARTATVSWDASELGDGTWELRLGFDGSGAIAVADMKTTTSFDVTGTSSQFFTIVFEPVISGIGDNDRTEDIPADYALEQNYPNPFNPETEIQYAVSRPAHVTLSVYNINGQLVRTLVDRSMQPGFHHASWNGKDESNQPMPSGLYLYRLEAGNFVQSRRMLLLK